MRWGERGFPPHSIFWLHAINIAEEIFQGSLTPCQSNGSVPLHATFPRIGKIIRPVSNNPAGIANPCVYTVYMTIHSWITISLADPRALYLQVIEQIKRRVAVGDLPPGAELPSIRQLAAELKISVITIKRAYLELEREGVILTRQGKDRSLRNDRGYRHPSRNGR